VQAVRDGEFFGVTWTGRHAQGSDVLAIANWIRGGMRGVPAPRGRGSLS